MLCPLLMIVLNFISILKILILFFLIILKNVLKANVIISMQPNLFTPHCPYCHSPNLKHNDHYTSNVCFITADASHPVITRLKKQRVLCNACLKRSMAQSNLINTYCHLSNTSKHKILAALTEDRPMTSIAVSITYQLIRFKESQNFVSLGSTIIQISFLNTQLLMNLKALARSCTLFVQMVILIKQFKLLEHVLSLKFYAASITFPLKLALWLRQSPWILRAIINQLLGSFSKCSDCH